ncbi:hypothetical protein MMC13_005914 [Lambiella insularis]|nr:hypothetical protein [Lambiella insularis]
MSLARISTAPKLGISLDHTEVNPDHSLLVEGHSFTTPYTKEQLEKDNAQKIAQLEKDWKDLEETKARLTKKIHDRTSEKDQEKALRIMIQEKMQKDKAELQGELTNINKQDLPEEALQRPVETSERLCQINPIFEQIPIAGSKCSFLLRQAAAEHIIVIFMCDKLWRPLFSEYLVSSHLHDSVLPAIDSGMAEAGRDFQHRWKVATLKMLDKLDNTNKTKAQHEIWKLVDQQITAPLRYLLNDPQAFLADLNHIVSQAVDLGKAAERNQIKVVFSHAPYVSEQISHGWIDWLDESCEPDYGIEESPSSPTSTSTITTASLIVRTVPLLTGPKLLRQVGTNEESELILPGRAIFSERDIFQEAAL